MLRFERLDRLFLGRNQDKNRDIKEQLESLTRLQTLLEHSADIYLGYSADDQHKFLSCDSALHSQVCVTVELWFTDAIYPFITEGTKRFSQMKMSPPIKARITDLPKSVFSLSKTKDKNYPNRFQAILPKWSLGDFDLLRWILGFGHEVKVVSPAEYVTKIKNLSENIAEIYR